MCGHPLSDTHFRFGVDVGFGVDQCDGDIGMIVLCSRNQRRLIILRTHNDTERQSKCAGIPRLTRTSPPLRLTLALALTSAMAISVRHLIVAIINGVTLNYEHTMILRDSPSVWASLI